VLRQAILGVPVLLVAASLAFGAGPAQAAKEKPLVEVAVLPVAHLADNGTMTAKWRVTCAPAPDGIQWESFVIVGEGDITSFAQPPLPCDGRPHVEDVVFAATEIPFLRADADVNAFVLDENTLDVYASDTRTVKVR
jgi:hypothetical protein